LSQIAKTDNQRAGVVWFLHIKYHFIHPTLGYKGNTNVQQRANRGVWINLVERNHLIEPF